ncbi:MAG: Holliday junction branch migration protein RuvA [Oscillospiraceae bacterium]|jgi:Holliday junction DNA helicase RuvA|nr:Holliday junction branch migration protein RuvA [Oscillospiraceae bacterium]
MLYSLRGALIHSDDSTIAVECGGVAYLCRATLSTITSLGPLGGEVYVYTYMSVKNETLELFAFSHREELDCFKLLTSVSGVGSRIALAILSSMTPERFALCVAAGDYKPITAAPGVGKKLSERIVLELRDKITGADFSSPGTVDVSRTSREGGSASEAISALVVLGYSQTDAAVAVAETPGDAPVEEIIKAALKKLAKRR